MTKRRRRRRKTSRTNNTSHHRSVQHPTVAAKVRDLQKRWRSLDRIDRGDRLRELIALGCSMRGLANELHLGLTTIRRHIDLADSPERSREAVRNGWSAKKLLAGKLLLRKIEREQAIEEEERRSGKYSDAAADLIIEFCRHLGYSSGSARQLMPEVRRAIPASWKSRVRQISWKVPAKKLFAMLEPDEIVDEFYLARVSRWLARILLARFSQKEICERATEKASKRARELDLPRPSLGEIYTETALRRQFIAEIPSRRKC